MPYVGISIEIFGGATPSDLDMLYELNKRSLPKMINAIPFEEVRQAASTTTKSSLTTWLTYSHHTS
jgi:hypothetical protein